MANSSSSSPKITKIARYEIIRELGRGGMATVYLARDPNFQREVAVKVLPRETMHDSTLYQRFQREARTIASLEHPAIVPVHDFGEEDGQPFLVMRYLSGGSLASRIKAGPLPVAEAAKVLLRIGGALDAAHAKGIVHRDLKPANILFDQYGDAYLSDFGIAQLSESTSPLTGSAIIGTPAYMSPEQIRGEGKVDGRADIYALGIVLFEMLTGKTPFKADTPAQMMMMHLANPTPRLPEEKSDLPDTINGVLIRAMAKDPDLRFQKASEIGNLLAAIAAGESPVMPETSQTYGYFKETSATRVDAEGGGPRRPGKATKRGTAEEPAAKSSRKWPIIATAVAAILCVCGIAGSAGGYALYKNPDALSGLFSPKGTAATTLTPTEKLFVGLDSTPPTKVSQSGGNPPAPTVDNSNLIGDKFEIAIGDEVSNGVPGAGAGNIETPGAKDIYTFPATAGQTVYIQITKPLNDFSYFRVYDGNNKRIVEQAMSGIATQDPGNVLLALGGTYTIAVGIEVEPSIGTYGFKLWDVPPPDEFAISIGDEVSNGVPGVGAGSIESPGRKDIYTFSATAGQSAYFQIIKPTQYSVYWQLYNPADRKIAEQLMLGAATHDPGVVEFESDGEYSIIVGNDGEPSVGTYSFKIWNVPAPDSFQISIGQEISNGVPGPGAGNIESPGVKDIYTFNAKAGETVYFQITKAPQSNELWWTLYDQMNQKVNETIMVGAATRDPGNITLDLGGTYTIIVGNDGMPSVGIYGFKSWVVEKSKFSMRRINTEKGIPELIFFPPDNNCFRERTAEELSGRTCGFGILEEEYFIAISGRRDNRAG
jgi:serine/threonine protein kinase